MNSIEIVSISINLWCQAELEAQLEQSHPPDSGTTLLNKLQGSIVQLPYIWIFDVCKSYPEHLH